jgi:type II secretory pathway component GspD/PulD (secretin)
MKKLVALLVCLVVCSPVFAQNISVDLKDAPVRTTLEMMFKQAGIKNYVIENSVAGFVTMKLEDQPFENSLKLVMRAATVPLTYTKENNVWIVKQRIFTETKPTPAPDITLNKPNSVAFEVIHLNHIDPFDLMSVLGNITFINQFSRYTGGMNGNIGGGFGASGGSGNNSMGGSGGGGMGNGNRMGGGAMGGFGGGAFGGMNGGTGGFGGGRNF